MSWYLFHWTCKIIQLWYVIIICLSLDFTKDSRTNIFNENEIPGSKIILHAATHCIEQKGHVDMTLVSLRVKFHNDSQTRR